MHFTWDGRSFEHVAQSEWLMPEVRQVEIWAGPGVWGPMTETAAEAAVSIARTTPGVTIRGWLDEQRADVIVGIYRELEAARADQAAAEAAAEEQEQAATGVVVLSPFSDGSASVSENGDVEASPRSTSSSQTGGSLVSSATESIRATGTV